jgi:hypothetical protein
MDSRHGQVNTPWPFSRYDMWPHRQDDSRRGQVYTRSPRGVIHDNTNTTHVPARCKRDGLSRGVMCGNTKSTRASMDTHIPFLDGVSPDAPMMRLTHEHPKHSRQGSVRSCTFHAHHVLCLYTAACLPACHAVEHSYRNSHSFGHCIQSIHRRNNERKEK